MLFSSLRVFSRFLVVRRFFSSRRSAFTKKTVLPIATQYVRKSPIDHILLRPETYIGSVFPVEQNTWLYRSELLKMEPTTCTYSPGLVKIFDEILVNAADNKLRDPTMTEIRVDVNREGNIISVWNNGRTLPIEIHPTEGLYVSSLVFGNLFTSSNYDDSSLRTVGGRNGFGAKLCNVYSKEFTVETGDKANRKIFKQSWKENMKITGDVEIKNEETEDFTKVTFSPDLAKFGMNSLTRDVIEMFQIRVVDVSGTLPGINVFFNGEKIMVEGFKEYISLFTEEFLFLNYSPRWKVGIARSSTGFSQISFVNNIVTSKGGKHVEMVAEKIVNCLKPALENLVGGKKTIRPSLIRSHLLLFVNCLIDNPSFESQTKEVLCTPPSKFGSTFEVNNSELLDWATSSGLLETITEELQSRKPASIKKSSKLIQEIPKLEDASLAGTSKSGQCTLFITEGDSAKAFAVAGLEVIGRDYFGVFPIRGKLINVSGFDKEKVVDNVEIANLTKILGLKFGLDYSLEENFATLRYGSIVLLADQDEDGTHIKGLILNFFHQFWPELVARKFVSYFRTPLIKVKKGAETVVFYSVSEFQKWKNGAVDSKEYTVKYYKGLGTSTSAEAREYFGDMGRHLVTFIFNEAKDGEQLKMAFDKSGANERKTWITSRRTEREHEQEFQREQPVKEFVDEDLVTYSLADLRRSIPSVVDGLKPSQRKVLHCLLGHKEKKEIKVNQLAGAVSMSQGYHHGEESLVETIIKMAQSFPGSNNLNLLQPIGQFGTRHEGGSDAARGRYIYTALSPITRILFPKLDDTLLSFVNEDGQPAEPNWYCPIVPLILINGAVGIGTGWATNILPHRPSRIIDEVKKLIEDKETEPLIPWWRDYKGSISKINENQFLIEGKAAIIKKTSTFSKVEITELPVGVWTNKYKQKVLLPLMKNGDISGFKEHHSEKNIQFTVNVTRPIPRKDLHKIFRLSSFCSTNSMVLFDTFGTLIHYKSTADIMKEHFLIRKNLYSRRLEEQTQRLEAQLAYTTNQLRFVRSVVNGDISLSSRSRLELVAELQNKGFAVNPLVPERDDFSYLLGMQLLRLTTEEIDHLEQKSSGQQEQLANIRKSSWQDTWMQELSVLTREINKHGML